jgi:hypothetical protein
MRSGSFTDRGRRGEPVFRQAALDRYQGHDIPSVAGNEPSPMRREHAAGLSERGVQPPFPTPIAACLPRCCDRRCDRTRGSEALDTLLAYELRHAGDRPPGFYFEVS